MSNEKNIGGFRPGSGRPKGAQNRRTLALADRLLTEGRCPAEALVRIAEKAEAKGETALAIDAWKAVLPYVHAKPKPVEFDPGQVVLMTREIAEARLAPKPEVETAYGQRLARAIANMEENSSPRVPSPT